MVAKVKFPLKMANGSQVRTLEELREHFDLVSVLGYYDTGRLYDWLMVYYYEEEAKKINDLDSSADDFKKSLCDILGVTYIEDESADVDLSDISERNERLAKLKTFTADDAILAAVDNVVFTQQELDSLLEKDTDVIYLCGEQFNIPAHKGNVRYIGVNTPKVDIHNDFAGKDVIFQGVKLDLNDIIAQAKETSDFEKSAQLWRIAAEQDHAEAQNEIGQCYYLGRGVDESKIEAVKWYRKAAEQGHAEAQYRLGIRYLNGGGVDKNVMEAVKWFHQSAEQGYVEAYFSLGKRYLYGEGVSKDKKEALEQQKFHFRKDIGLIFFSDLY